MAYNTSLGYDPDKDYSLAIRNASSDAEIKQLQAERQSKIDGMYGGNDPYNNVNTSVLYGSDWHPQTATAADSQVYRNLQDEVDGGITRPATSVPTQPVTVPNVGGYDAMTQYINDMYAQSLEAELAALKSAYDSNVAELESQNDRIAEQYRAARNQLAGQNELQRMQMNELGIAQGLNTGATGQMALAQNMAYQGNLGNLWAQEAQTQADVDLTIAQLMNQYNSNVQQVTANINAQRSAVLYDEMVRQQQLAIQQQEAARDYALSMLSAGVMPDSGTLSDAGISANEVAGLLQMVTGTRAGTPVPSVPTVTTPTVSTPTAIPKSNLGGYNNGGLTTDQIKILQAYYGTNADGLWGINSTRAAGGLSAADAWKQVNNQLVGISQSIGMNRTAEGQLAALKRYYDAGTITEAQANALIQKFKLNEEV